MTRPSRMRLCALVLTGLGLVLTGILAAVARAGAAVGPPNWD